MGIICDGQQAKYLRMVRITATNTSTFYISVPSCSLENVTPGFSCMSEHKDDIAFTC